MSHGTVYTEDLLEHVEDAGQRAPYWPPPPPPKYADKPFRHPAQVVASIVAAAEDDEEPLFKRCNVCRRAYSGLRVMHGRSQCSARCARIARDGGPS